MNTSVLNFENTVASTIRPNESFPDHSLPVSNEYRLLTESVALILCNHAILSLRGKDSNDFLQRLSTNDVKTISLHQTQTTVLVTEKAKIIDVATVVVLKDELLVLLESTEGETIQKWLNRFLFTEDVSINNVTSEYEHCLVVGPQAISLLEQKLNVQPLINQGEVSEIEPELGLGFVFQDLLWKQPVFHVVIKKNQQKEIMKELFSEVDFIEQNSEAVEIYRVDNGVLKFGNELSDKVNPLEAGLERFISWTKGCYIGQEVIARIDTYKKLQRHLTGFIFSDDCKEVFTPGKLYFQDEEVGWTTSHVWSSKLNKQIALGFLKTNLDTEMVQFRNEQTAETINIRVSNLPFQL